MPNFPGRVYHRALLLPPEIHRADVSRKLMAFSREIKVPFAWTVVVRDELGLGEE